MPAGVRLTTSCSPCVLRALRGSVVAFLSRTRNPTGVPLTTCCFPWPLSVFSW